MVYEPSPKSEAVEISVVIPVRNEERSIRTLLEGLLNQTLPAAEIVITDTGSTDQTTDIIEEFVSKSAPIKLLREREGLPGRGRNVGAANSRCDWIAFTDAGIKPSTDWLAELAGKARQTSADVVYGTYDPVVDSFFKECAAISYVPPPLAVEDGFVRAPSIVSALMRRRIFENAGGFPEHLRSAEDLLFMRRVAQSGANIVRTAKAIVYWDIQPNLSLTFRRFAAYAANNIRAGLFFEWQGKIFIYYALLAALTFNKFVVFRAWGLLGAPLLWMFFLSARAVRALYRNRQSYPGGYGRNLARICLIVPILATLDAATFVGSLAWLWEDKLGLMRSKRENESQR